MSSDEPLSPEKVLDCACTVLDRCRARDPRLGAVGSHLRTLGVHALVAKRLARSGSEFSAEWYAFHRLLELQVRQELRRLARRELRTASPHRVQGKPDRYGLTTNTLWRDRRSR